MKKKQLMWLVAVGISIAPCVFADAPESEARATGKIESVTGFNTQGFSICNRSEGTKHSLDTSQLNDSTVLQSLGKKSRAKAVE